MRMMKWTVIRSDGICFTVEWFYLHHGLLGSFHDILYLAQLELGRVRRICICQHREPVIAIFAGCLEFAFYLIVVTGGLSTQTI